MEIIRDRYLDDSSLYRLTLRLGTRTPEMHSLLSDMAAQVEHRLGQILVRALDEAAAVIAESRERGRS